MWMMMVVRRTRHDAHRPNENEERKNQLESKTPPNKHGPPTGGLTLMSFCGVTVTANKLANLPIRD